MSVGISSLARAAAVAALLALTTNGAHADSVAASGDFRGASNHAASGEVQIVKGTDGGYTVVLGDDFNFDGAPDPRVGLGRNGTFDERSDAGALGANHGKQSYSVPAGLDASSYNEVYIWCRKYSVPLGIATVK